MDIVKGILLGYGIIAAVRDFIVPFFERRF
jgi:hypothetical protein